MHQTYTPEYFFTYKMQGIRFNRISALSKDKTNWKIKVRLTRLWPGINSSTGEFKGLNMILLDDDVSYLILLFVLTHTFMYTILMHYFLRSN